MAPLVPVQNLIPDPPMSIHPSLRGVNNLTGERSVFTRVERVQQLLREGKLQESGSALGLPKVRTKFKIKTKRGK